MLRTKRDVDQHVEQLEKKISSTSERNLKAFSIAKLYHSVGEYEAARKYVMKYLSVQESSAVAHKLLGQIMEALGRDEKAIIDCYKTAMDLDPGQKEIVLKVCELITNAKSKLDEDTTQYWLEMAEKYYPKHKNVTNLKAFLEMAGNGNSGLAQNYDDSPILSSRIGSSFNNDSMFLNVGTPVQRLDTSDFLSTSSYLNTPGSAMSKPNPDRLAAQVQRLEAFQEKIGELLTSQNRNLAQELKLDQGQNKDRIIEQNQAFNDRLQKIFSQSEEAITSHHRTLTNDFKNYSNSILQEMKIQNQSNVIDMMKLESTIKQEFNDLKGVLSTSLKEGFGDMTDAINNLAKHMSSSTTKSITAQTAASTSNASPIPSSGPKLCSVAELQDALAQQTALLQMSNLGYTSGMFARPPLPPNQPPQHWNPAHWNPGLNMPPVAGHSDFVRPLSINLPTAPFPIRPLAVSSTDVPRGSIAPPDKSLEKVNTPLDFRMKLPTVPSVTTSPLNEEVGPAVPITTTSLLSKALEPTFSSLSKTPSSNTIPSQNPEPDSSCDNFSDMFKPKAGSLEYNSCTLRNDPDTIQFKACENTNPGHEEEVKKKQEMAKPNFSFGATGTGGFNFGSSSAATSSNIGAQLFQPSSNQQNVPQEDDLVPEDANHDPHFEPVIPLPELVEVTTGEEEEDIVFKHRAKVYRFDPDVKQWKERGIGDIKLLKHPSKNTFRVLLRREQIHKIACNHLITTEMELKPMFGSESALTWFAMDYADEEQKMENLAVKFKLSETKDAFKKKFEECQEELRNIPNA